jgi:tetratricopeptide (TPR) repeat protein
MAAGAAGLAYAFLRRNEPSESRRRFGFLFYLVAAATVFYLIAFKIGVVDVRFLPFGQIFLILAGAGAAGRVIGRLGARELAALSLALAAAVWTAHFERSISSWTRWNYSGWEEKPLWPAYQELVRHLEGDFGDGRIVYEHAARTNAVGTIRAFECLPLFAGRATLEGAYIQASPNAPYVFYIQSETSPDPSVPLSLYNYSRFDPERALRHLALFNVTRYITVTEIARQALERTEGYRLEFESPPFTVFRVENSGGGYVVQPRYRPVLRENGDPRREGFEWFRFSDGLVPVVFAGDATEAERKLFGAAIDPVEDPGALRDPPRAELPTASKITTTMGRDEIIVEGAEPGRSLWIKVSYHPNWKVDGAAKVWRTAPAFMLVFPEQSRVRLHYGWGFPDYLGVGLTFFALLFLGAGLVRKPRPGRRVFYGLFDPLARKVTPYKKIVAAVSGTAAGGLLLYMVVAVSYEDPTVYFNRGVSLFNAGRYDEAVEIFRQGLATFPISREADQSLHHSALARYNSGEWAEARETWLRLEREFPESRVLQQTYFHLGLTAKRLDRADEAGEWFSRAIDLDLGSPWADAAMKELFGKAPPNGDK